MASLNYAYRRKSGGIPWLILILLIASNITSADVSISNSYYTSGGESHENVALHNMVYSNDASVFGDTYSASSAASTADNSEPSKFSDKARSSSIEGPQAYSLQAEGSNDIGYSRSLSGGSVLYSSLNYNMGAEALPGAMQIDYRNSLSSYNDNIYNLVNTNYAGTLLSYGSVVFISGKGTSNGVAPSSFNDTMSYVFSNKDCKMDSYLLEDSGANAVDYLWKTFLSQGSSLAITGINLSYSDDNTKELGIKGTSSILNDDKFSPLYMRYVLR
jgi:hypothetical protein